MDEDLLMSMLEDIKKEIEKIRSEVEYISGTFNKIDTIIELLEKNANR